MTKLTKPVSRETTRQSSRRNIIVTLAPAGGQNEALVGFRLKGTRTQYVCTLSSLFQMAALWHGQKEQRARREARKNGVPWKLVKKQFISANSL